MNESWVLPAISKLNGRPEVAKDGQIVCLCQVIPSFSKPIPFGKDNFPVVDCWLSFCWF